MELENKTTGWKHDVFSDCVCEQADDGSTPVDFCERLKQVLEEVLMEELLEPNAWRPG